MLSASLKLVKCCMTWIQMKWIYVAFQLVWDTGLLKEWTYSVLPTLPCLNCQLWHCFMLSTWIMSCAAMLVAGETLQDERSNGGAFVGTDGLQFPLKLIPVSYMDIWLSFWTQFLDSLVHHVVFATMLGSLSQVFLPHPCECLSSNIV